MQGQITDVRIGPTGSLTTRIVHEGSFYYVGKALSGTAESEPKWHIYRMTEAIPITILFANGSTSFVNIWNNRASLSYS